MKNKHLSRWRDLYYLSEDKTFMVITTCTDTYPIKFATRYNRLT